MGVVAIHDHWDRQEGRPLPLLLLCGVLVFAAACAGIELTHATGSIAAIWFANAIAVLCVLKSRRRQWLPVLSICALANFAADLVAGNGIADAAALTLFNLAEILIVLVFLRRLAPEGDFTRPKTLAAFYALALGPAPLVSALLAAVYFALMRGASFEMTAFDWYLSNALGLLVVVPPLATVRLRDFVDLFAPKQWPGTLLLLVGMMAVVALNYAFRQYPLGFLFFPAVLLMTFVRGFAGGTLGLALMAGFLLSEVFFGSVGSALAGRTPGEQVIIVETFAAVVSFSVVMTGATLAYRRRLENDMAGALGRAQESREEALVARNAAEKANRTKSMFLANMSHELRTPLNAIIGFSEIMQAEMFGALGDQRYGDYARMIREAGEHLLDLINDVLDMSKIEAGKFEIDRRRLDAREVVGDCLALMKERAAAAGVSLAAETPQAPLWLHADRRALKQILLNLLSNAVKFTPAGGAVTVEFGQGQDVRLAPACRIAVRDTGVGIPAEQVHRLANPFVQIRDSADRAHKGTGLGLALARALAEMHGGSLAIESELGAGTTVSVELPFGVAAVRAA